MRCTGETGNHPVRKLLKVAKETHSLSNTLQVKHTYTESRGFLWITDFLPVFLFPYDLRFTFHAIESIN